MKHTSRLALLVFILGSSSLLAVAQTSPAPSTIEPAVVTEKARTTADETFELNIDRRHIVREQFEASTALSTDPDAQGLDLQIGVALGASRIDVLLMNVRGRVRFRGSLDRILDVLNRRR